MSTDSPRPSPRVIGAVWLLYFITSAVGAMITKDGPMSANLGLATARIAEQQALYRAGLSVTLLSNGLYVALSALLYGLFAPVNRSVSLAAAFLSLTGCVVQIGATLLQLGAITLHSDPAMLASFSAEQVAAAVLMALKVYRQSFYVSVSMFALFNLVLAYLIYRSRFIPRVFALFFLIAGSAWIFALWPPLASVFPYVGLPASGLAELGTTLWLLVKGIDTARWREAQAG